MYSMATLLVVLLISVYVFTARLVTVGWRVPEHQAC